MHASRSPARILPVLLIGLSLAAVAACGSASSGPSSPPPSNAPSAGAGGSVGTEPGGSGGGEDPNTGTGSAIPGDPPVDPGMGEPKIVIARPGSANLRDMAPVRLEPSVDGRHVLVRVSWWSGVEDCNTFDHATVERRGNEFTLGIVQGSGLDPNAVCIDIAELHGTVVDLGELEPGTYTVLGKGGQAPPVEVTVA
jgi:hypothetical protein